MLSSFCPPINSLLVGSEYVCHILAVKRHTVDADYLRDDGAYLFIALDVDNDVYSVRDQAPDKGNVEILRFKYEALKARECRRRRVRVQRADAARVARVPGFEQIERVFASDFTDS